jgi:hypothetical protein
MKKLLYLIISSTILFGCVDKNNSRFKGGSVLIDVKLENMSTKLVALEILSTSKTKTTQLDTLEVDENGSAKFYYNALKTSFYSIYLPEEKDGNGGVMFMAEPGDTIKISGNAKKTLCD